MRLFNPARALSSIADRIPCINIQPCATAHLNGLFQGNQNSHIRLSLNSGGCNGFRYQWEWGNGSDLCDTDDIIPLENGKLVIDAKSAFYLAGSELYYENTDFDAALTFKNPNAQSQCGCGESFAIK